MNQPFITPPSTNFTYEPKQDLKPRQEVDRLLTITILFSTGPIWHVWPHLHTRSWLHAHVYLRNHPGTPRFFSPVKASRKRWKIAMTARPYVQCCVHDQVHDLKIIREKWFSLSFSLSTLCIPQPNSATAPIRWMAFHRCSTSNSKCNDEK